jgi:hypothetical protein
VLYAVEIVFYFLQECVFYIFFHGVFC